MPWLEGRSGSEAEGCKSKKVHFKIMTQTGGRVREGPRLPASLNGFSIALVT